MMPEERRVLVLSIWNGIVIFGSLFYLDGGLVKSAIIALFVGISCQLHLGRRWLLRGGLLLALVAIAVSLGFPPPAQWPELGRTAQTAVQSVWAAATTRPAAGTQH